MDEQQIRTVLAVMNLTAPFEMIYVAEREAVGVLDADWGIEARYRFYLVSDDSKLLFENGIVKA